MNNIAGRVFRTQRVLPHPPQQVFDAFAFWRVAGRSSWPPSRVTPPRWMA